MEVSDLRWSVVTYNLVISVKSYRDALSSLSFWCTKQKYRQIICTSFHNFNWMHSDDHESGVSWYYEWTHHGMKIYGTNGVKLHALLNRQEQFF